MAGITSLGLGSGIDIRAIVDALIAAERAPQEISLARQEADIQAKISSFGSLKSSFSEFRVSLAGLRDTGKFSSLQASTTSSNITASVSSNAEEGSFNIESKQLAQAQSLASAGFADANAVIGTGILTIKFGATDYDAGSDTYNSFTQNSEQGTLSIELDANNNSLIGLRDAVNEADAGVEASIIFDGSDYRLILTSEKTGAENSLQISVDDPSLSQFEFNAGSTNMSQTQEAKDAILSINGLDVTSSSNKFNETLKGVELNLTKAELGETIRLDISRSSSGVVDAVDSFVEGFNNLVASANSLSSYDAETQTGSVLLGDSTLRSGMNQIKSVMSSLVSGLEGSTIRTLIDLGISTQLDGTLEFDKAKLTEALKSDPNGVAAVFTQIGRPSDDKVIFVSNTDETLAGKYDVNIAQGATQSLLTGANNSIASLVVNSGINDTFKIKVDGFFSTDITLTAGTYSSADELAAEIQAQINGNDNLRAEGAKVSVEYDSANNRYLINSQLYGDDSGIEIVSSTGANIGLATAVGIDGTDIEGTIGGIVAEGDGQTLLGANGLELFVEGDVSGSLGNVVFSRGLMERLDVVLGGLLDKNGTLSTKTEGLQKSLDLIDEERLSLNDKVLRFEQRTLSRFNAMDALLGQIQGTGDFLAQQLASLPYNNLSDN